LELLKGKKLGNKHFDTISKHLTVVNVGKKMRKSAETRTVPMPGGSGEVTLGKVYHWKLTSIPLIPVKFIFRTNHVEFARKGRE